MKLKLKPNSSVSYRIIFYMAYRNVMSKKLRSFLTIFGVVIGISAISFLVSFGLGLQLLVQNEVVGDQSIKAIDIRSTNSKIVKLSQDSYTKIQEFPHIEDVGVNYSFSASIGLNGGESDAIVYGVDETYLSLTSLELMEGELIKNNDTDTVVVSIAALKTIGIENAPEAIGKEVNLTIPLDKKSERETEITRPFKVIGVINSESNSELFISKGIFEAAGVQEYTQLKAVVDNTENVAEARKQIESLGLETSSPIDTLAQINQLFTFFNLILASFGAIGMIVAVLGMFNTLTISLIERTKEIGLMITLGARQFDMRLLFLVEALILSFTGVVIGIIFSIIGGEITNAIINQSASNKAVDSIDIFSTPLWLIAGLITFMMAVGLVVVYFPARRAEKINPIDALRRE